MRLNSEFLFKIYASLEENRDNILIMAGIILLLVGVLDFSISTSSVSVFGFFFGISLTIIGVLVRIEVVTSDSSAKKKLGSFLISVSVFCFSGATVSVLFQKIAGYRFVVPVELHVWEAFNLYVLHVLLDHPFYWLFVPLLSIGLLCLIFGIILKKR